MILLWIWLHSIHTRTIRVKWFRLFIEQSNRSNSHLLPSIRVSGTTFEIFNWQFSRFTNPIDSMRAHFNENKWKRNWSQTKTVSQSKIKLMNQICQKRNQSGTSTKHEQQQQKKTKNKAFTFTEGERALAPIDFCPLRYNRASEFLTMSIAVFCLLPFRIINCISLQRPQRQHAASSDRTPPIICRFRRM